MGGRWDAVRTMAAILKIPGWDDQHENNRSRELKRVDAVLMPNDLAADFYVELVDHPQGAAHLGVWLALSIIASRCEPRGQLIRDNGQPHDPASLARLTRIPLETVEQALPRLAQLGWIVGQPQLAADAPHDPAGGCGIAAERGRGGRGGVGANSAESLNGRNTEIPDSKPLSSAVAESGKIPQVGAGKKRDAEFAMKLPALEAFPMAVRDDECRMLWQQWLIYKAKARKKPYKTERGHLAELAGAAAHGRAAFIGAINNAMDHEWQGPNVQAYLEDSKKSANGRASGMNTQGRIFNPEQETTHAI